MTEMNPEAHRQSPRIPISMTIVDSETGESKEQHLWLGYDNTIILAFDDDSFNYVVYTGDKAPEGGLPVWSDELISILVDEDFPILWRKYQAQSDIDRYVAYQRNMLDKELEGDIE